jgi:hypothetical protein
MIIFMIFAYLDHMYLLQAYWGTIQNMLLLTQLQAISTIFQLFNTI